jgi:2-dehydro-3-deoxyphosphooctonate aldolase (KDO 8-P synthase)
VGPETTDLPDASRITTPVTAVQVGSVIIGPGNPLAIIAGPCVLESLEGALKIADRLAEATARIGFSLIFKASFDKANRTSLASFRGPGIERGLEILAEVSSRVGIPVTTDVHLPDQAEPIGKVCQLLQIPAFLARQTDLLAAAAATGRAVNVKKGQFMAPGDMRYVVDKLRGGGATGVMLCERGTFFGYGRLVNDMSGLPEMRQLGVPVVFDATHSVQQPGGLGGATGGNRAMVPPLARAAVAVGVDAVFLETHPNPDQSPSDGPNMVPLNAIEHLLQQLAAVRRAVAP